ncbi:MAG TPA: plasmid stabilization protein [Rhizomicrobium sp.]|jgi:plasmid stability protein|nr:plasmid stabilization protein [Rhizomicrobium sp.]
MASITIRNLGDDVKKRLRRQAADHGRSLEAEARDILSRASVLPRKPPLKTGLDLVRPLLEFSEKYGGAELEAFPDQVLSEPPARFRRKGRK